MEIVMPILKSLTFTNLPDRSRDPVANRRAKLVGRLEEQRRLVQDPSYLRVIQRWTGKGDERRQVEKKQSVRPWWRADASGNVVLCVYYGTKPIEFEKGKPAIAVPSRDKLPSLIDALIAAAKAGELDELITRAGKPVGAPKSSRRAA
jgi:hypothetical protein